MRKVLLFFITLIASVGILNAQNYTQGMYILKNSTYHCYYGGSGNSHKYGGTGTGERSVFFKFESAGNNCYYWKDVINNRYLYVDNNSNLVSATTKDATSDKYKWCIIPIPNDSRVYITTLDNYNDGDPTNVVAGADNKPGSWLKICAKTASGSSSLLTLEAVTQIDISSTTNLSSLTQNWKTAIMMNGGTLVVDAALNANVKVYVEQASTVTINSGQEFNGSNVKSNLGNLTLDGSGTATNVNTSAALVPQLAATWTGTVKVTGTVAGLNLNSLANNNSTVEFNGASGYFTRSTSPNYQTYTSNIILTNNGNNPAFNNNNGWDGDKRTFSGNISGDGTFKRTANGTVQTFIFSGDVSGWTGKFENNSTENYDTNVKFEGNATSININMEKSGGDGKLNVEISNDAIVSVSKAIRAVNNITLSGTGAKTFSANVEAATLIAPETCDIGIVGNATFSLTGIQTVSTLNIVMNDNDVKTVLANAESYTLISCSGSNSVSSVTLNGLQEQVYDNNIYRIVKDGGNIVIKKIPTEVVRTTATGKFGTICLPYAATISGATVYTATVNEANDAVELEQFVGSKLTAGKPYIYFSTNGAPTFRKNGDVVDTPVNPASGLIGTFTSMSAPVDSYVLQTISGEQKFRKVVTDQQPTVGAYRCYVVATDGGSSAREMTIELSNPTGIDALNAIVSNNAEIYDIAGRKVNSLRKGINIVNGAKVIVK